MPKQDKVKSRHILDQLNKQDNAQPDQIHASQKDEANLDQISQSDNEQKQHDVPQDQKTVSDHDTDPASQNQILKDDTNQNLEKQTKDQDRQDQKHQLSEQKQQVEISDDDQLSYNLIEAQYQLRAERNSPKGKSVLILVNGIELAGKGEAVKQLREWVDPRHIGVKATVPHFLNHDQPFWQPYANHIPAQGQITLLFGNWYSDLLMTAMHVSEPLSTATFEKYIEDMQAFEADLQANHVHVIKVWFDLSWDVLQQRLDKLDPTVQQWQQLHGLDWRSRKQYNTLQKIRKKFTDDWIIIEGEHENARDRQFANEVLTVLRQPLVNTVPEHITGRWKKAKVPAQLCQISNDTMQKEDYKPQLKKLTQKVSRALRRDKRKIIIAFEGVDAAGKGGAIKRIIKDLDPREYDIYSIAAPEQYELHRPYLWRFWTKLNSDANIQIFDRTWYGRVLVERVESFAKPTEWKRAYAEINRFEADLIQNNSVVIKFWLAISLDEQALRFQSRENTPHKRFKITQEDWRNREKWDQYLHAAADMFEHTNTQHAPWHIIATNDKRAARIQVLEAILSQLEAAL